MTGTAVVLPGMTATAFHVPGDLDFTEWQAAGHVLGRVNRASAFWIGDWILHGEDRFGEVAAQAIDELGLDAQTISNYRWIARTYAPSSREVSLSWRHHFDAAGLDVPERTALLTRAKNESWGTRQVRAEANRLKQLAKGGAVTSPEVGRLDDANVTKLGEILAEVLPAILPSLGDDPAWLYWVIAKALDGQGVRAQRD